MKKFILLFALPLLLFSCKKDSANAEEQARIDKAILLKYIADSSLVVDSTASGLYYVTVQEGTGANPGPNAYVTVYYKGYFINGEVFDQNPTGRPISFFLNQVITGWKEGLQLMKEGGKAKLLIPSGLGYGPAGAGDIPPNTVLIFDVELANF